MKQQKRASPSKKLNGRLTIRNVARLAGVSAATVSRVMNGKFERKGVTHDRINRVLAETGYAAGSRSSQPTMTFLMVGEDIKDVSNSSHEILIERSFQQAAEELNVALRILRVKGKTDFSEVDLNRHGASGFVFVRHCPAAPIGCPMVALNFSNVSPLIPAVDCDDFMGIAQALAHLKSLGHERVAFFNDRAFAWFGGANPRRELAARAYPLVGLPYDEELFYGEDFMRGEHPPVIERAVEYFLALTPRPTAIVLCGDCYAPCLYEGLKKRGVRIPHDMSVFGFDDFSIICEMLSPTLSSIRKPFDAMAKEALKLLMAQIAEADAAVKRMLVTPKLVLRGSTAAPPS